MYLRRRKFLVVSLVISLIVLVIALCAFFIIREFWSHGSDDKEICIKTRCMPGGLFRRSASSYICSPKECVITSSNDSDISETCVPLECITKGDRKEYHKVNSSILCLDTVCLKASAIPHLKAGGNCSSTDCIVSAAEILKSMDQKITPCENFYRFSCHGTVENSDSENEESQSVDEALSEILDVPSQPSDSDSLKKIKTVYRRCIDERFSEETTSALISDVLKRMKIGDWPLLGSKSNKLNYRHDLEYRTAMLHVYGVESFFHLEVEFSGEDSAAFIKMSVAPPLIDGICSAGNEEKKEKDTKEYGSMFYDILLLLLKNQDVARHAAREIVKLDRQFCMATQMTNVSFAEEESNRNHITLEELADIAPDFNWRLWHNIISSEFDIDSRLKNAPIYVYDVHLYINNILELLSRPTAWVSYLSMKFMLTYMGFLDRSFRQIMMDHSSFFKDHTAYAVHAENCAPRGDQCRKYLQNVMGIALIPSFATQVVTEDVEKEMDYLAELMKYSFKETFHHSGVLYDKEKKQIMKTITKFGVFLLYPNENETFYDDYYSNMELSLRTFLETGMQVRFFHQKKIFDAVYRGSHDYDLELKVLLENPFQSQAFAAITENKTAIFIGGTHVAGVKLEVPRYMNFATLGTTIALEYVLGSHLLSVRPGRDTFDTKSKKWRSWPEYIRGHVSEKYQCYLDRYSVPTQDNGDFPVHELMANVQALKESLKAYRMYCEKYGHEPLLLIPNLDKRGGDEQLFFILYAQSLCGAQASQDSNEDALLVSPEDRVNEVLRNLDDFADAFHCQEDSPMNPDDKCGTVW